MTPVEEVLARARQFVALVRRGPAKKSRGPLGANVERPLCARASPQLVLPHLLPNSASLEKTIWGSPAGKKRLAARLVKLIPSHETYVEPFAGSAAVFFEKPPADVEVLSDADPEIAFAFRAIKSLTSDELAALRRKDWVGREKTFRALVDARPRGKVEKLYRFLYLSHFSYGKLRGKSYNPNADGVEARTMERLDKFRDRIKAATIRGGHYAKVVKEFDGKNTFFFLDPPYPGHNVEVGEDTFDESEFRKVLEGIKGKFLVTYGTRGQLDTSGFHVRKIRTPRTIRAMRGVDGPKTLPQLLISNYAITEKAIGMLAETLVLDAVEIVDFPEDVAWDIERARVLSKALGRESGAPDEVARLVRELDRLDPVGSGAVGVLAGDLLTLAERVSPKLVTSTPDVAAALDDATLALEKFVKAQWTRGYINDLPDTAFLYIEPGGEKDEGGRTTPRSLRHFPVRGRDGQLDIPHLRNALARVPQSNAPGLTADRKSQLQDEARRLLTDAQKSKEDEKAQPSVDALKREAISGVMAEALKKNIPMLKTGEERFVFGIVLEPETVDAQKDIYSAAEVRDAAHRFMEEYQNIGLMHRGLVNDAVRILESYVAPAEFEVDGTKVKKGTWLLAVRVQDDTLWQQVKSGALGGFSIGGSAVRSAG